MTALLTTDEVAGEIRTTPRSVRKLVNTGQLPARKVIGQWLVARADLDAWLAAQPSNAQARDLMARPSFSLTIGQTSTRTFKPKSFTIWAITAACW